MDPAGDKNPTGVTPTHFGEDTSTLPPPPIAPTTPDSPTQPPVNQTVNISMPPPPVNPVPPPPPPPPPPSSIPLSTTPPTPKRKWGTGALAGVAAVFLVIAMVVTGVILYQRRGQPVAPTAPASQPEAAPSGFIFDMPNYKITVVDSGPGNYETALAFPGGQNDARAVPNQTLVQTFRILNKTEQTHTYKVWAYPYKMYTLSGQDSNPSSCQDLYTSDQISSYTTAAGGADAAYLQFTEDYYAAFEPGEYHCYDNAAAGSNDPSVGQPRILGTAGSIDCSYLAANSTTAGNCADMQTLVTVGQSPPYFVSSEQLSVAPDQELEQTFSITNPTCGFYQWDHGILIDDTEFVMTGSEIKFFPCATTASPSPSTAFQCQEVNILRAGVEILPSQIQLGDQIVFRGFASATNTTVSKLRFTLTKGGLAQTPVEQTATLSGTLYQADFPVTIDQATSYSVTAVAVSP